MTFLRPEPGVAVADHPLVTRQFRDVLTLAVECGERVAWHVDRPPAPEPWWRYIRWADRKPQGRLW